MVGRVVSLTWMIRATLKCQRVPRSQMLCQGARIPVCLEHLHFEIEGEVTSCNGNLKRTMKWIQCREAKEVSSSFKCRRYSFLGKCLVRNSRVEIELRIQAKHSKLNTTHAEAE